MRSGYGDGYRSSPAERDTVSSRRCKPTDRGAEKRFRPWRGRTIATVNPFRVDRGFASPLSVGFTYGYSRGGPLRGHIHLAFRGPNLYVAHPPMNFRLPFECELWDYLGSQPEPLVPSKT